jgi:putative ABC transport system permease protein
VVLALISGVAGLLVAFVGIRFLIQLAPPMPLLKEASIDLPVLAFTVVIALITGVAFGMAPAFQAFKIKANVALNERGTAQGGHSRIRTMLTVAEVALAVMLLVGAALLTRSFIQLRNVDVGFNAEDVLTAFLSMPPSESDNADRTVAFLQKVIARVDQIPGVAGVAGASAVPLISNESSPFRVEGRESSDRGENIMYAEQPKITPGYFRVMRIGQVRGREFNELDIRSSQPVAIVSENLARTYWPGEDAIGKRLSIDDRQWRTIVGIVRDVRHDGMERPARPTIYIPFAQYPRSMLTLLVRSDANPAALVGTLRSAVMDVDKNQPLFGIQTMEQILGESVSLRRFLMILVGIFAAVAVLLGTVGVYGVLAYLVSQRKHEIGVRMALGANRFQVVTLIMQQGTLLAVAGVGLGVVGSLALSRALSGMLFGVSATDPWTFVVVPAVLFFVMLLASSVPALAAASVEPMSVVRGE